MKNLIKTFAIVWLFATFSYTNQTIKSYITNEWQDSRYTDHNDATVTDTNTSLMWMKCSIGLSGDDCLTGSATTHTWEEALILAKTTNTNGFANYNDWRLPNIKELASLAALDRHSPSININMFPNTKSSGYWSSSLYGHGGSWVLYFYYGGDDYYGGTRENYAYVRLVRGSN